MSSMIDFLASVSSVTLALHSIVKRRGTSGKTVLFVTMASLWPVPEKVSACRARSGIRAPVSARWPARVRQADVVN